MKMSEVKKFEDFQINEELDFPADQKFVYLIHWGDTDSLTAYETIDKDHILYDGLSEEKANMVMGMIEDADINRRIEANENSDQLFNGYVDWIEKVPVR